jgi:hypothetical protein
MKETRLCIVVSGCWGGRREWESWDIHIKQAVVDEQLLEFQSNLNGNMISNLKGGGKKCNLEMADGEVE